MEITNIQSSLHIKQLWKHNNIIRVYNIIKFLVVKNDHNLKKSCDYTSVGQNHRKFLPNAIIMDYILYIQVVQMGSLQFSWDDNHQKYEGVQSLLAYLLDFSEYIITHVHFWPGKKSLIFFQKGSKS